MAKAHAGRTELGKAALKRMADAWALHRAGKAHARGAAYLGGYAIECKLKAMAMEVYDCRTLSELADRLDLEDRDIYPHGLEALALRAMPRGFYDRLRASAVWRDFARVNSWRPDWRYNPNDWTHEAAEAFLSAVDRVWLDSNRA